jgi:Right handed beta helix region
MPKVLRMNSFRLVLPFALAGFVFAFASVSTSGFAAAPATPVTPVGPVTPVVAAPVTGPPLPPVRSNVTYVSPNGSDSANGFSEGTAWKTLNRVQQALDGGALRPGATVAFQRNGTFSGTLRLTAANSGTPGAPVTFGAYGVGTPPVIDGGGTLSGWTSSGSNLWSTTCAYCPGRPAGLSIDGTPQALARWPNANEGDGYRYFSSFVGRTELTDNAAASINWVGGELVVRSIAWVLDRQPIVAQSGGTLTMGAPTSYDIAEGYGYFIQDHPSALDRDGEWTYNPATKTITLFSAANPTPRVARTTNADVVLSINGASNVTVKDLAFRGGASGNIAADECANIVLDKIISGHTGGTGIRLTDCRDSTIRVGQVNDAQDLGVDAQYCTNCRVLNTSIERIAIWPGMGLGGDGHYLGARIGGPNGLFEGNTVNGIGYIGVDIRGTATVRRNTVRDFNRVKVDGGGIYTYENADTTITDNIVSDAPGSTAGIPWTNRATHGIYIDDNSQRVVVSGNTVARVGGAGVLLHNANNVSVTENTLVGTGEPGLLLADDDLGSFSVTGLTIQNNTVVSDAPGMHVFEATTRTAVPNTGFLANLGQVNNNRYCGVFENASFRVVDTTRDLITDLAGWQAATGKDAASTVCNGRNAAFVVSAEVGPQRVANGTFSSNIDPWYGWPREALSAAWDGNGINGGSLRFLNNGQFDRVHIDAPIGALAANQMYRMQFKSRSNAAGRTLKVYLRQAGDPYSNRSTIHLVPVGTTAGEYEFYIPALQAEPDSLLIFELDTANAPVWLDDVTVQAVAGRAVTADEVRRVETNATGVANSITLDATYTDVSGTVYPAGAVVTIAPYRSVVLLKRP